jgi:hypothetical protein
MTYWVYKKQFQNNQKHLIKMSYQIIIFLLRILFNFAKIIDGLLGLLSLTLIKTNLTVKVAKNISWYRYQYSLKEENEYE